MALRCNLDQLASETNISTTQKLTTSEKKDKVIVLTLSCSLSSLSCSHSFITPWASSTFPSQPSTSAWKMFEIIEKKSQLEDCTIDVQKSSAPCCFRLWSFHWKLWEFASSTDGAHHLLSEDSLALNKMSDMHVVLFNLKIYLKWACQNWILAEWKISSMKFSCVTVCHS